MAAAGVAWRLPFGMALAADFRRQFFEARNTFSFGTEYAALSALTVRAGCLLAPSVDGPGSRLADLTKSGLGAGVGLRLRRFQLDYSFTPFGELGSVQRLSLGARY